MGVHSIFAYQRMLEVARLPAICFEFSLSCLNIFHSERNVVHPPDAFELLLRLAIEASASIRFCE